MFISINIWGSLSPTSMCMTLSLGVPKLCLVSYKYFLSCMQANRSTYSHKLGNPLCLQKHFPITLRRRPTNLLPAINEDNYTVAGKFPSSTNSQDMYIIVTTVHRPYFVWFNAVVPPIQQSVWWYAVTAVYSWNLNSCLRSAQIFVCLLYLVRLRITPRQKCYS